METKLGGGGDTGTRTRAYIQPTRVTDNTSNIAKGVNDLIQSVGKFAIKQKIVRDGEDRVMMKNHAQDVSTSITLAMQGQAVEGKDSQAVNTMVSKWRSGGMNDTKIRRGLADYYRGTALKEFGAEQWDDAGDNAVVFLDTFNRLEMQATIPLAKVDKENTSRKMSNQINSSFISGSGTLQERFDDGMTTGATYNIPADYINAQIIQSAFMKAKRTGDDSDIEALQTLKDSDGNLVINGVQGAKTFSAMKDAKALRERNEAVEIKNNIIADQKQVTEGLYTSMVTSGGSEDIMHSADMLLEQDKITMPQHQMFAKMFDSMQVSNSHEFSTNSDAQAYQEFYSKANQGVLTQDELYANRSKFSFKDFQAISRKAIEKGGAFGIDNQVYTLMEKDIKAFAVGNSGLDLMGKINNTLEGLNLGKKRESALYSGLSKMKYSFELKNGRLPTEDELEGMQAKVLKRVDAELGTFGSEGFINPPKKPKPIVQPKTNKLTDILSSQPDNSADYRVWFKGLTKEQRKLVADNENN